MASPRWKKRRSLPRLRLHPRRDLPSRQFVVVVKTLVIVPLTTPLLPGTRKELDRLSSQEQSEWPRNHHLPLQMAPHPQHPVRPMVLKAASSYFSTIRQPLPRRQPQQPLQDQEPPPPPLPFHQQQRQQHPHPQHLVSVQCIPFLAHESKDCREEPSSQSPPPTTLPTCGRIVFEAEARSLQEQGVKVSEQSTAPLPPSPLQPLRQQPFLKLHIIPRRPMVMNPHPFHTLLTISSMTTTMMIACLQQWSAFGSLRKRQLQQSSSPLDLLRKHHCPRRLPSQRPSSPRLHLSPASLLSCVRSHTATLSPSQAPTPLQFLHQVPKASVNEPLLALMLPHHLSQSSLLLHFQILSRFNP